MLREREQQDTVEVIDWASRQPWSNGRIGMNGISYSGINQVQVAEKQPPALKAIFPVVPGSDLVNDVLAPGGGFGFNFIPLWLTAINGLKLLPDLASVVNGQFDTQWLADRAKDPLTFMDVLLNVYTTTRVEDLDPRAKELLTGTSAARGAWLGDPSKIQVPTFVTGGWHDLFTYSESKIYNEIPLPAGQKQLLMGNTYHINSGNEYGKPGLPPRLDVLQRAWFDKWLKGIDNGIDSYGPVTLRQQGGGWITTDSFADPDAAEASHDAVHRRMYLSADRSGTANSLYDGSLLPQASPDSARLTVAPGLTTLCSNDAAQGSAGALDHRRLRQGLAGRRDERADVHQRAGRRHHHDLRPDRGAAQHRSGWRGRLLGGHRERCRAGRAVDRALLRTDHGVAARGRCGQQQQVRQRRLHRPARLHLAGPPSADGARPGDHPRHCAARHRGDLEAGSPPARRCVRGQLPEGSAGAADAARHGLEAAACAAGSEPSELRQYPGPR